MTDLNDLYNEVGLPIRFWPGGDKEHENPITGVITETASHGRARITLFYAGGGDPVCPKGFVRHISDPWIQEHPEQMRRPSGSAPTGAWEALPPMGNGARKQKQQELVGAK